MSSPVGGNQVPRPTWVGEPRFPEAQHRKGLRAVYLTLLQIISDFFTDPVLLQRRFPGPLVHLDDNIGRGQVPSLHVRL